MNGNKVCSKCRVSKPLDDFYAHRNTKDGKGNYCKDCAKGRRVKSDFVPGKKIINLDGELWMAIPGYEELYEVSNLGRIKSLPKDKYYFGHKKTRPAKLLSTKNARKDPQCNYIFVSLLTPSGIRKTEAVHRLVAKAFVPNPGNRPEVNHMDTNRLNNRWDNLEWLTRPEHVLHTNTNVEFNRKQGEDHWKAKLTEELVIRMRREYEMGVYESYAELSRKYGINRHYAANIIKRKNWDHI